DSLAEAAGILTAFRKMARVPFVVALNRSDGVEEADELAVRSALDLAPDVPLVPCDATDRESVKSVLLALLYAVLDSLESAGAPVGLVAPVPAQARPPGPVRRAGRRTRDRPAALQRRWRRRGRPRLPAARSTGGRCLGARPGRRRRLRAAGHRGRQRGVPPGR